MSRARRQPGRGCGDRSAHAFRIREGRRRRVFDGEPRWPIGVRPDDRAIATGGTRGHAGIDDGAIAIGGDDARRLARLR